MLLQYYSMWYNIVHNINIHTSYYKTNFNSISIKCNIPPHLTKIKQYAK